MAITNGTAGNDQLFGSSEADTINGFAGNDKITGDEGNDLVRMGAGNDTFFWHVGDGSDTLRGQAGFDTLVFECSAILEGVTISQSATRAILSHSFGATMDLLGIERIYVQALAEVDTINIGNLANTDVTQVLVDLASAPGIGSGGDGEVDTVGRGGGSGNDVFNVTLVGENVSVTGPAAAVTIRNADAGDFLEIAGLGGNDTINASKLPANIMRLTLDGGLGNDTIIGSQGNDFVLGGLGNDAITGGLGNDFLAGEIGNDTITGGAGNDSLFGDAGNDVIAGGRGNDTVDLGTGNDVYAYSAGDGIDLVEGGSGFDTLSFTGTKAQNIIDIKAGPAGRARVSDPFDPNHLLDINDVERLQVRALGGLDFITLFDLAGTDLTRIDVDLAATAGGTVADSENDQVSILAINAAAIDISWSNGKILVSGLPTTVSISHAGTNDRLAISSGSGDDTVYAGSLAAGKISLEVQSGAGDDVIYGSAGNDVVFGGMGNDVAYLDAGNDTVRGGDGNDRVFLGAGNDLFQWFTGEGKDTVKGQAGIDTLRFGGSVGNDVIFMGAAGGRVQVNRNSTAEGVDLSDFERIQIQALAGMDVIDVINLAGTGIKQVSVDFAGTVPGKADGEADRVEMAGTLGNDTVTVAGSGGTASATGLPAQVIVTNADAADSLTIRTGEGNDAVNAAALTVGTLKLTVDGGAGRDTVTGSGGNDSLDGGTGADSLLGGGGSDTLHGGDANDRLDGGAANDTLWGDAGNDVLIGGLSNDLLIGGQGNDTIIGGSGNDRLWYMSVLDGHDVFLDFDGNPVGGQDVLDLDPLFDNLSVPTLDRAARVSIVDKGATVDVFVNADGDGGNGFELAVATLHTVSSITVGQDVFVGT